MLKREEIHVGLIVWWSHPSFNCPCVVTRVAGNSFSLLSITDTSVAVHMNDDTLGEMRATTLEVAREHADHERQKLEALVSEKRRELLKAQTALDNEKEKLGRILEEFSILYQEEEAPLLIEM